MTRTNPSTPDIAPADTQKNAPAPWAARLAALALGAPRRTGGLALYPLLGEQDGALNYHTLDDALMAGVLTISEVGASGAVPELSLKNNSSRRVLIVDGEELIGAKQNRIVNTSVLAEAHSALLLPVSCVEAGRWHAQGNAFHSEGTHYNARGRQQKVGEVSASLASQGRPRADQGRVWADVDAKLTHFAVPSDTRALHAVTQQLGAGMAQFADILGAAEVREVGAVFALGREIVGVDLFDQVPTHAALLPKLVASYALDAMQERPTAAPPPPAVVAHWLQTLQAAQGTAAPGVGLGQDIRLAGPNLSGAALVADGIIVHLSAFRAASQLGTVTGGMARASVRRGRA